MNAYAKPTACCTNPRAMRYWTLVFLAALVPLVVIAVYWHPLSGAAGLFAAGIACIANWSKNRTYHCGISGPIFILAGTILLVAGMQLIHVEAGIVWSLTGVGVLASLLLEWRYAKRASPETDGTARDANAPGRPR